MDAARLAYAPRRMRRTAILFFLIVTVFSTHVRAQTSTSEANLLDKIKQLSAEQRWIEIVQLVDAEPSRSAEVEYHYGIALARLERWAEARSAFKNGLERQPGDKRFPLELAGVSFKQNDYAEAAKYLRRSLRLDSSDQYANDFMASLFFLQANIEASLLYWNRVSKPHIEEVRIDPTLKVDPVLLDHAFAFAPAAILRLSQLRTTDARVDRLRIFPTYRFDLEARPDGKFDVVFRARERNGWGNTRWEGLLSLFRGIPFQTVHPEYFNIGHRAINFESLFRWDKEKRRLWASLSGPFSREPKRRFTLGVDLRNENWDLPLSIVGTASKPAALNLHKQAFTGAATTFVNGRWSWSGGFELSHREFRDVVPDPALTPQLLAEGFQLKQVSQFDYELLRAPQRRVFITVGGSTEIGRIWSEPSQSFAKLQGSLRSRWFPQSTGDDYEVNGRIRAGKTFGEIPFDELFVLGVERDNDLWLRSHIGTRDGRKGSAPLGRNYFLSNMELDKTVYNNALISLKLGPFLDTGKITDSSPGLGSQIWLWDIGVQAKVRVLGWGFSFSYGKDLRSGNNAFYVSTF